MSLALRQRASLRRLAVRFGGTATATVRRHHTLHDAQDGSEISTLAVNGTASAGATTINLDTAPRLHGSLPQGITFTIAGDGTTYTVASRVNAASNALASVAISPALAAEAADDAVVTVAETVERSIPCAVGMYRDLDKATALIEVGDRKVLLATGHLPWTLDREFDTLILPGETAARTFKDLSRYKGGTIEAGAKVQVSD